MDVTGENRKPGIRPFSAVLLMVALSVIGLFCIPRLQVQYKPSPRERLAEVSYSLSGASAEAIEAEVTSKLEGVLSRLRGVTDVSSISRKGSGSITLKFRKGTNIGKARLEVASAIRNVYPTLPRSLTYPTVTVSSSGKSAREGASLIYTLKGTALTSEIERYARENLLPPISALPDVDGVRISGVTPCHWVITFDAAKVRAAGLQADAIARAIQTASAGEALGLVDTWQGQMAVRLSGGVDPEDFGSIPIETGHGSILHLRDLADWQFMESEPQAYYRVNGLNTINLAVMVRESSNLLVAVQSVKNEMRRLEAFSPQDIQLGISYDASEYVREELNKIYLRTGLCLIILFLFVLVATLSWRYLAVMAITLTVNILSALALYAVLGIPIHIYTLAGITVSLGIVIDTSIVMVDHYARWRNRKILSSLFIATFTTVAALLMVFLLPEEERLNLADFVLVVVVNLSLSLLTACFFVPSLMELMPLTDKKRTYPVSRLRRLATLVRRYRGYIVWGCRHKWIVYSIVLLLFAWSGYVFYHGLDRMNFYRQPERKQLVIQAGMQEGCTVSQLNEIMHAMENYLAQFQEIETFVTSIFRSLTGSITVEFKPEYERSGFPSQLKSRVIEVAKNYGGATWSVFGVDDLSFNNDVNINYRNNLIRLSGYNYRQLLQYAQILMDKMAAQPRINSQEIWTAGSFSPPGMEFNLKYDFEHVSAMGVNPFHYYNQLGSRLYDRPVGYVYTPERGKEELVLRSSDVDRYDLWHVMNEPIQMDGQLITLSDVGAITKQRSGIDIRRENRAYQVDVCFDFLGQDILAREIVGGLVDQMNHDVLPVGYKAQWGRDLWHRQPKENYLWIILLIVAVIFVALSMAFNSLRLPFAVISLIPVSLTGVFMVFGYSDFSFDQGGFAALVMLNGIVVNAGIYLVNTYRNMLPKGRSVLLYMRAFRYKILPILLTSLSTLLGLLPFFSDGPQEVFWFDFALGTVAGLIFSLVALVFLLPLILLGKKN